MHIFFSVGEPSGDQHAAHLIEELRRRQPGVRVSGFGGPMMEQAGCGLLYRLTDLAVMGFLAVVPLLWKFYKLIRQANRFLREERPDAVVLIDYPGFNWWVARKAKAAGIPVFYFLPPQMWAWAPWRIRKMRKFVDHVLCGLSFEAEWYNKRGVEAEFVGHPFFDEVADKQLEDAFCHEQKSRRGRIVGILPGSRNFEVHGNWPVQIDVMHHLRVRHPDVRFLVANYRESHREFCRFELERWQLGHPDAAPLPVELHVGRTSEIIELSECCVMVSGSVSLEMMARRTPAVVIYRWSRLVLPLLKLLVSVRTVSLPNLMAGRKILPEVLIHKDPAAEGAEMARLAGDWLADAGALQQVAAELDALAGQVGQTGATRRAAQAILSRVRPAQLRTPGGVPENATRAA